MTGVHTEPLKVMKARKNASLVEDEEGKVVADEAPTTTAKQACAQSGSRRSGGSSLAAKALQLTNELVDGFVVLRLG